MNIELIYSALNCISLIFILLVMIKLRKLETSNRYQGQLLAMVKQEMEALLVCEKGMGQRIKQQQQQVRNVIERQDKLEISDGSKTSYKQAMILLQKGASTNELIEACDLSRGELNLLARLKAATTPSGKQAA